MLPWVASKVISLLLKIPPFSTLCQGIAVSYTELRDAHNKLVEDVNTVLAEHKSAIEILDARLSEMHVEGEILDVPPPRARGDCD